MNLVFSFDENYVSTFRVFLYSIYSNNKDEAINIYLLHYDMREEILADLQEEITGYHYNFYPLDCKHFIKEKDKVSITRYYTIEMYLWLFAPYILPEEVDRALYLDPDIINLNSIRKFYDLDFEDNLFIAMDYKIKNQIIQPFNNLRLGTFFAEHYFNSGVVLMNIDKLRKERSSAEISEAVVDNKAILILPDQDVFNHLYADDIKSEEWEIFNMDPRLYQLFNLVMPEKYNFDWVEEEIVFIHYAGQHKPWLERNTYKMDLGEYYFGYEEKLFKIEAKRESEPIDDKAF